MFIRKATDLDIPELVLLFEKVKEKLCADGYFHWTESYPGLEHIKSDIEEKILYVLVEKEQLLGAVSLNEKQEEAYQTLNWAYNEAPILVVHRLVVLPSKQGQGLGKILMNFIENFAKENGNPSIRLDTFSENNAVVNFYKKLDYQYVGDVFFRNITAPFYCLEKSIPA